MSRTAVAAVNQTPTGANALRLIDVIRYTIKSTGCYAKDAVWIGVLFLLARFLGV